MALTVNVGSRPLYVVHFHHKKLSTLRNIGPLTTRAFNAEELATKVYRFALQHLPNAIMEVELDPDVLVGRIITAWQTIATFEAFKQT